MLGGGPPSHVAQCRFSPFTTETAVDQPFPMAICALFLLLISPRTRSSGDWLPGWGFCFRERCAQLLSQAREEFTQDPAYGVPAATSSGNS